MPLQRTLEHFTAQIAKCGEDRKCCFWNNKGLGYDSRQSHQSWGQDNQRSLRWNLFVYHLLLFQLRPTQALTLRFPTGIASEGKLQQCISRIFKATDDPGVKGGEWRRLSGPSRADQRVRFKMPNKRFFCACVDAQREAFTQPLVPLIKDKQGRERILAMFIYSPI